MARNFGKVEVLIWKSPKFRALSDDGKMLWLYLLACPHGNAVGCFVLDPEYIQADLKWTAERVSTHMLELVSRRMIERDPSNFLTFISDWWGHNTIENGFVAKAAMKTLKALPRCDVFCIAVNALDASSNKFLNRSQDEFAHLYKYASENLSRDRRPTGIETKEPEPEPEPVVRRLEETPKVVINTLPAAAEKPPLAVVPTSKPNPPVSEPFDPERDRPSWMNRRAAE